MLAIDVINSALSKPLESIAAQAPLAGACPCRTSVGQEDT